MTPGRHRLPGRERGPRKRRPGPRRDLERPGRASHPALQFGGDRDRRCRDAIAVFGPSYSWHLSGGSWGPTTPLAAGSSGGLAAADPAGTFVYADSSGNAFTFAAGASSFGTGGGSRGSLADLKIVPGLAVMLAAGTVSAETVNLPHVAWAAGSPRGPRHPLRRIGSSRRSPTARSIARAVRDASGMARGHWLDPSCARCFRRPAACRQLEMIVREPGLRAR